MYTRKAILLNSTIAVTIPRALSEAAGIKKGWPIRLSYMQPDIIIMQPMLDPTLIDEGKIMYHLQKEKKEGAK